jgi:hypothetical protein
MGSAEATLRKALAAREAELAEARAALTAATNDAAKAAAEIDQLRTQVAQLTAQVDAARERVTAQGLRDFLIFFIYKIFLIFFFSLSLTDKFFCITKTKPNQKNNTGAKLHHSKSHSLHPRPPCVRSGLAAGTRRAPWSARNQRSTTRAPRPPNSNSCVFYII